MINWITNPLITGFPEAKEVLERHMDNPPLIGYQSQPHYNGEAVKISDFLTRTLYHRLEIYNDFYKRFELEDELVITLPASPPFMIGFVAHRGGNQDFSERDRLLLNLLRPHLVQAYQNADSATQLRQEATSMNQAVEELDQGVIVLGGQDRVLWCTEQASNCLAAYFEPPTGANRLPESLQRWVENQLLLLSEVSGILQPQQPLILKQPETRLVVRLIANQLENRHLLLLEEHHTTFSAESLGSLGVSSKEAEILFWIVRGKPDVEIARELYISPRTVHKHLENIYQKLWVASRTAAIARGLEASGQLHS